jgi:hypothetical protein
MKIRTRTFCALAGALAFAAQAFAADDYPRLGGYPISGPHDYETAVYQKNLAKLDVSVLTIYPGWEKSHHTTMGTVASNIKAINPKSRVFVYVIGESFYNPMPVAWTVLENKVNSEKWWLYTGGTSKVLSDFGHEAYVLNMSTQSRRDANGQTFGQWFANYVVTTFEKTNPTLDGIYTDNVFWKPRRDGDWNLDGKIDDQNATATQKWYREGYRQYAEAQKKAMPGKLILANVADWVQAPAVLTEYDQLFNGGVIEAIIGKPYSIEARQGWAAMMVGYRKAMAAMAAPKLGIFEQWGNLTDYQAMRYGLTSCLMDNGYYTFGNLAKNNYGVNWFDEYDSKLGAALKGPTTTAWQNGVYRRDFENGIALVNPKGNGSKEVTLEEDFVKLKGAQDPTVNSGQTVRKVTLKDRDGIILMRKNPVKRPAAPAAVTIESAG